VATPACRHREAAAPSGPLACSPEAERRDGGRRQSPACSPPLVRSALSFRGTGASSSALLAWGAPPAVRDGRGVFLVTPCHPGLSFRDRPLVELAPLQSSFVASPPALDSPPVLAHARVSVHDRGSPPLLSFSLPEHTTPGAPCQATLLESSLAMGEGCQALTGAVHRVGSLSTVLAASGRWTR